MITHQSEERSRCLLCHCAAKDNLITFSNYFFNAAPFTCPTYDLCIYKVLATALHVRKCSTLKDTARLCEYIPPHVVTRQLNILQTTLLMLHLVKCVTDDFNVHLVQVLLRYAVLEECSWKKNREKRNAWMFLWCHLLSCRSHYCSVSPPYKQQCVYGGTHPAACPPGWRCKAQRGSGRCWPPPSARSCPAGDTSAPVQRWPADGGCRWSAGWRYRSYSCTWRHTAGGEGMSRQSASDICPLTILLILLLLIIIIKMIIGADIQHSDDDQYLYFLCLIVIKWTNLKMMQHPSSNCSHSMSHPQHCNYVIGYRSREYQHWMIRICKVLSYIRRWAGDTEATNTLSDLSLQLYKSF